MDLSINSESIFPLSNNVFFHNLFKSEFRNTCICLLNFFRIYSSIYFNVNAIECIATSIGDLITYMSHVLQIDKELVKEWFEKSDTPCNAHTYYHDFCWSLSAGSHGVLNQMAWTRATYCLLRILYNTHRL